MTMNTKQATANVEQVVRVQNGWAMLVVVVGSDDWPRQASWWMRRG